MDIQFTRSNTNARTLAHSINFTRARAQRLHADIEIRTPDRFTSLLPIARTPRSADFAQARAHEQASICELRPQPLREQRLADPVMMIDCDGNTFK